VTTAVDKSPASARLSAVATAGDLPTAPTPRPGTRPENVEPGAIVSTDELYSYGLLTPDGYKHGAVKHGSKEWATYDYRHDVTHSTNSVESFWKLFKNSIRSTHIHVSAKYMDRYLNEFAFRSNNRHMGNAMFDLLIGHV
jgi:hypothetical protein